MSALCVPWDHNSRRQANLPPCPLPPVTTRGTCDDSPRATRHLCKDEVVTNIGSPGPPGTRTVRVARPRNDPACAPPVDSGHDQRTLRETPNHRLHREGNLRLHRKQPHYERRTCRGYAYHDRGRCRLPGWGSGGATACERHRHKEKEGHRACESHK